MTDQITAGSSEQLTETAARYQAALEQDPDNPELLHRLGRAMGQLGQRDLELALVGQALARRAGDPGLHADFGLALLDSGHTDDAQAEFEESLRLDPAQADALGGLAEMALDRGDTGRAGALADRCGPAGRRTGRVRGRLAAMDQRWDEAVDHYLAYLTESPTDSVALFYLGVALQAQDLLEPAAAAFAQASRLEPAFFEAHANLATVLTALGRTADALDAAERAVTLAPDRPGSLLNRANARRDAGDMAGALTDLTRAVGLAPGFAEGWSTLGNLYHDTGDLAYALDAHRRAVEAAPSLAQAHWNRAFSLLASGQLAEGWDEYEWRRLTVAARPEPREYPWAPWNGESVKGKRVLVWREQGIGDEIHFATCLTDLAAAGARITLLASPRLVPLFARSFPTIMVLPDGAELGQSDFDFQVGIASLPRALRRNRSDFLRSGAFLAPDPAVRAEWALRLSALGPGPKIGLCWRSGLLTPERIRHYPDLSAVARLVGLAGVVWVNLQYDDCAADLAVVEAGTGVRIHRWADLDLRNDLDGVAGLIAGLDGVVTAATAVSSMAAALGRPTWQMDSGSDWTVFGERVSPWFPSLTVVRRAPDESGWLTVVGDIRAELVSRLALKLSHMDADN